MRIIETPIPDLIVIEPRVFGDERGFFLETFQQQRYQDAGLTQPFVQINHSRSGKGVLRGLHFQKKFPQGKLVYVSSGAVFDVAVDLRPESASFGKWYGIVLSDDNHFQMFIPPGFAHGFCVLSDKVDFIYKCTEYYHPNDEGGIIWNDPDIGIEWPIKRPLMSQKDHNNLKLQDIFVPIHNIS